MFLWRGAEREASYQLRLCVHVRVLFAAPGAVGHLSFTDILDTSLKVSWKEPQEKNGLLTGDHYLSLDNMLRLLLSANSPSSESISLVLQAIASPGRSSTGPTHG